MSENPPDFPSFLQGLSESMAFTGVEGPPRQPQPQFQPQAASQKAPPTTNPKGPRKRERSKYIPRACQDCQRRKVKCSGETTCYSCRMRGAQCVYLARENDGRRKRNGSDNHTGLTSNHGPPGSEQRGEEAAPLVGTKLAKPQDQAKRFSEIAQTSEKSDGSRERRRLTFTSTSTSYTLDMGTDNGDDTDTFYNGSGTDNLSIPAQLADLQNLLRLRNGLNTRRSKGGGGPGWKRVLPLELPPPSRLFYLLDVYFRELDSYFPLMDQGEAEARICEALERLGYSDRNQIIDVDTSHYAIIALLCSMLVLGECEDPEVESCQDIRPGWTLFQRGWKLIQHCGSSRQAGLDIIRYHTLSAVYMMHSELLQPASQAIATAIQLAMASRLNTQSLWDQSMAGKRHASKRLWWTIYFLDRRIAQRNGTPYMIRDAEVAVDEFHVHGRPRQPGTTSTEGNRGEVQYTEEELLKVHTENYLQSLVDFGRLWGQIWDSFYAANANKAGNWKEIALMDTRIHIFRMDLPPELTWKTDQVSSCIADGETEPTVRRRLAIYIRTNLLRMIIRQNPLLSCDHDQESRQFCADLARSSIEAIAGFTVAYPRCRTSAYFLSTALVECIYHLVYILLDQSLEIDRPAVLASIQKAYQLLSDFAPTWATARRALHALDSTIFSGGTVSALFDAITRRQGEQRESMQGTPRDDALGLGQGDMNTPEGFSAGLFQNPASDSGVLPYTFDPTLTELSDFILQQDPRGLTSQGNAPR